MRSNGRAFKRGVKDRSGSEYAHHPQARVSPEGDVYKSAPDAALFDETNR